MGQIHRLDDVTINKIAAGEVIERPASVVKELLENALDANARRIHVKIVNGGRSLIQIVDDGHGMDREDAVLALERHATSKIRQESDLGDLSTLGFRGEALPSIAAVSRFELETRTGDSIEGTLVVSEGGKILSVESTGAPIGTRVSVQELYFNTPARLKFLKSIPTETSHIKETVSYLALAYPEVSFTLHHGDMELLFTPGDGELEHAIAAVFGMGVSKNLIKLPNTNWGPLWIAGYIGRPEIARPSRSQQIVVLNRRWIRSRAIGAAVEKAFHTYLPIARFPFFFLDLRLDPALVDFNVHPAKTEVRFLDEREVFRGVYHLVSDALHSAMSIPTLTKNTEVFKAREASSKEIVNAPFKKDSPIVNYPVSSQKQQLFMVEEAASTVEWMAPTVSQLESKTDTLLHEEEPSTIAPPIGVFDETFLISLTEEGIILTDQHAAHERIRYEHLMKRGEEKENFAQGLLEPIVFELSSEELALLPDTLDVFKELGFDLEWFGPDSLLMRALPSGCKISDGADLLHQIIHDLIDTKPASTPIKERILTIMACRTAVKAGDRLTEQEATVLLKELAACDNPYTCPHGRPTQIRLDREAIYKMFRRI